jgi:hypothetical protein
MYLNVLQCDRTATECTEVAFSCIFPQSPFLDLFPALLSVLCLFWSLIFCLILDLPIGLLPECFNSKLLSSICVLPFCITPSNKQIYLSLLTPLTNFILQLLETFYSNCVFSHFLHTTLQKFYIRDLEFAV